MKRFTISVPKDLKEKLDKMPDINWPEVAKEAILERLELLKKLKARGEL